MPIASAKVTSKGQITLPATLRERLGIKPGDRLDFEQGKDGRVEIVARTKTFADLRGIIKTDIRLTDEQLEKAIADAATARWRRFIAQEDEGDRD
jgi:antitoxin PrlF